MSSESILLDTISVALDPLSMKESLERLIHKTTTDSALYEDLLQEALVHLWLTERRRPGQTQGENGSEPNRQSRQALLIKKAHYG